MFINFFYIFLSCIFLITAPNNILSGQEDKGLIFHGGYTFSSFKNQKSAAVYITIINNNKKDIQIISLNTDIAKKTEIHEIIEDKNIVRMKKMNKLNIKTGETIFLQPDGKHIMLFGLNKKLEDKEKFLIFFKTDSNKVQSAQITVIDRNALN